MKRGASLAIVCAAMLSAVQCHGGRLPLHDSKPTVQALMVSDIHFDPFWDPAKTAQLEQAPASEWKGILSQADSADREKKFAALDSACHERGIDSPYALFASSLKAMRANAAGVKFVTVSGDLMAHSFACKYRQLFPKAADVDYRAFVEKTIGFVMTSLRETFPHVPVYAALGNNDTDCDDYRLDADGKFLGDIAGFMTSDLPQPELKSLPELERKKAERDFAAGGYYSAALPLHHVRILVLDDLFMARKYATCAGKPDPAAGQAQIAWLTKELERARKAKEKVWVMAHIPPGVDPYSTIMKAKNLCGGGAAQMFLGSEAVADAMAGYGDVIPLAIFAHTHMDEMRLLEPGKDDHGPVAVKVVPSISPIDGNNPAFTVGTVDVETGVLVDYHVIAASDKEGSSWTEEYDYAKAYQEPSFAAGSLESLIAGFKADTGATTEAGQNYLKNYFAGDVSKELRLFWPQYVCALDNHTENGYRSCVCPGK